MSSSAFTHTTPVYAIASNMVSVLGMNTAAHWRAVSQGRTGISRYEDASLSSTPFYASKLEPAQWQVIQSQTKATQISQASQVLSPFEQMAVFSARQAMQETEGMNAANTVLVLSTTKGNIEWLGQVSDERLLLHNSAGIIAAQLGIQNKPVVVSHACTSGVVALQTAARLLQAGRYRYAIIIGCDRFSKFVLSGFQSFQAIANEPCRPFDADRKGINLGEAAATIILSTNRAHDALARLASVTTSNDANHISGPSRTGEELSMAIDRALQAAGITASQVNMISAHGTATPYNDEMEAKAFALSGLLHSAVHSFKGYTGHTLGAAGVLETAIAIEAMRYSQLVPSAGYEACGVSQPLNVTAAMQPAPLEHVLKTASGFGGCNAALVMSRE